MTRISASICALGLVISTTGIGCGPREASSPETGSVTETQSTPSTTPGMVAIATLSPTSGNEVRGTVTFTEEPSGVRVSADVTGLTLGDHGIHVHAGDCNSPDGSSAGDHFNPTNMPHGGPDSPQRHLGDLGNITADASGHAVLNRFYPGTSLQGANAIIGRAVIVHGGTDDFTTQPSGNAGGRVACGVITAR